jgi:hypothetical protein
MTGFTNGFAFINAGASTTLVDVVDGSGVSVAGSYYLEKNITAGGTANTSGTLSASSNWMGVMATFKTKVADGNIDTPAAAKVRVYGKANVFEESQLATKSDKGINRSLSGQIFDFDKRMWYSTDCMAPGPATAATGPIDSMLQANITGAGAQINAVAANASHPGIWSMETGTTATGEANVNTRAGALVFNTGDVLRYYAIVKAGSALSAVGDTYSLGFGFSTVLGDPKSAAASGVWLFYSHTATPAGGTNANWALVHGNGALVADPLDDTSSVVFNTGIWYKLAFEHTVGTGTSVWIDAGDGLGWIKRVTNFASNLPSTANSYTLQATIKKSIGTTNRTAFLDALAFEHILAISR